MTPLLTLLLLATPPTTIHPHPAPRGATMATQNPHAPGGGNNNLNRRTGKTGTNPNANISYPIRHPNIPFRGARSRIGMDASNPTETTPRPTRTR